MTRVFMGFIKQLITGGGHHPVMCLHVFLDVHPLSTWYFIGNLIHQLTYVDQGYHGYQTNSPSHMKPIPHIEHPSISTVL